MVPYGILPLIMVFLVCMVTTGLVLSGTLPPIDAIYLGSKNIGQWTFKLYSQYAFYPINHTGINFLDPRPESWFGHLIYFATNMQFYCILMNPTLKEYYCYWVIYGILLDLAE